jgi:hypothetical protein
MGMESAFQKKQPLPTLFMREAMLKTKPKSNPRDRFKA